MVAWSQRREGVVYPAWWENREYLLARRLREMNYGQILSDEDGLPSSMTIKKNASAFYVWVDGKEVYRQQFVNQVEQAAKKLAAWVEAYRRVYENPFSDKAVDLLKRLRAQKMALAEYEKLNGTLRAALEKDGLVARLGGSFAVITAAGIAELRGLPEFD